MVKELGFYFLPDGLIELLLKHNHTLQALNLIKIYPKHLSIKEVNTPLTALKIQRERQWTDWIALLFVHHLRDLRYLSLPCKSFTH